LGQSFLDISRDSQLIVVKDASVKQRMEITQDEKDQGFAEESYLRQLDQRSDNMSAAYRKDPLFNEAAAHKPDYSKNKAKPE
jgi:hypothetical protein